MSAIKNSSLGLMVRERMSYPSIPFLSITLGGKTIFLAALKAISSPLTRVCSTTQTVLLP